MEAPPPCRELPPPCHAPRRGGGARRSRVAQINNVGAARGEVPADARARDGSRPAADPPVSAGYGSRVFAPVASATSAAEGLAGAVADAHVGWLLAAVLLHVGGQLTRGFAWGGVLAAAWPGVSRRRACAWHICGAGLTGVLSARGGDVVRIGLAKRELEGASWPALGGTLAAEGSFELVSGVVLALAAVGVGAGGLHAPSPTLVGVAGVAALTLLIVARRSPAVRRVLNEIWRGLAALREPHRFVRQVLPWQIAGRLLRLASLGCFLHAFGLPAGFAVIVVASVTQGSGRMLPIPGAGTAAAAAALLAVMPVAAGHPVDASAVGALAITQPALLTLVGISVSLVLLTGLLGVRTPRALARATRALAPQPAGVKP
jgi:hypothetical protein